MTFHNRNTDPNRSMHMVQLAWIGLSLFGVAMAWTFLQEWPPLGTDMKIACTVLMASSSAMFLYLSMDGADRDGTMDAFWRMRAGYRQGMPVPPKHTPMGRAYRYAAARLAMKAACEYAYAMGCVNILPWGAAVLAMHALFRFGFDAMRDMRPDLFDGSDPDMAATAILTEPAIDAVLAAFLLLYAWRS